MARRIAGIIPSVMPKSPATFSATFRGTRRGKEYNYEKHEATTQKRVDGHIQESPMPGTYWVLEINAAPGLDHYANR